MQVEIDPLSDVPLYQQLRDRVVEGIAQGALRVGEPLASVRHVAVAFGINVATVSKGYDLLRAEGLIRTHRKSGSVVARGPQSGPAEVSYPSSWTPRLRTLVAEASDQGLPDAEILRAVAAVLDAFAAQRDENAAASNDRPDNEKESWS